MKNTQVEDIAVDYNDFWADVEDVYKYYPSFRHRMRIILRLMRKFLNISDETFVFDYGCGNGLALSLIKDKFGLMDAQLGGCDISEEAANITKSRIDSADIFPETMPLLDKKCDIILCSEIIEHTDSYKDIVSWIRDNLKPGGKAIISTQSGRVHSSDRFFGHLRHFKISELKQIVEELGLKVEYSLAWGFPLFTLQKYLTNVNFDKFKNDYIDNNGSLWKLLVFKTAYLAYFIHDFIRIGPQVFIVVSKGD